MNSCNRDQYSNSNVVLPGIRRVQVNSVSTPVIYNFEISAANTEYSYSLPNGTMRFEFRSRDGKKIKIAYNNGESDTSYRTIHPGETYREEGIDSSASLTLYFQSTSANVNVEIVSWS